MSDNDKPNAGPYTDIAPALNDYTRQVLFGQVWERPELPKRDRAALSRSPRWWRYTVSTSCHFM